MFKQSYDDLVTKTNDKDLRMLLKKLIDVCEYLNTRYNINLEYYQIYDEDDYNSKDDNGKLYYNIYFRN